MAAKQVPPPLTEGDRRITERPYESPFARLPDDEVHRRHGPGAGPAGTLDDGPRNLPLLTFVVGFAVTFLTFALLHWAPLALGFALMLAGLVWGLIRARPLRLRRGVGTVRMGR